MLYKLYNKCIILKFVLIEYFVIFIIYNILCFQKSTAVILY